MTRFAVCADVGSTYTKVAVVDLDGGVLAATAQHRTTADSDVLHGLDAAVAAACAEVGLRAAGPPWYVASSAGGGLRLAVIGYEELVTARAGRRVGLSAGARVVHVAAGRLDGAGIAALRAARPDVVLLVGGTDGGDAETLRHNAARLARARWRRPVVVAGNADARDDVVEALAAGGVPVTAAANVLPRLGVLDPGPARAAIREVFLRHVIGGKRLSRGRRFASLVRGATPDVVLAAVDLLADSGAGDLLLVDVGGATTDVYSALVPDPERAGGARREVTGELWRARTVEGDLGVRWNAGAVVEAAAAERLVDAAPGAGAEPPGRRSAQVGDGAAALSTCPVCAPTGGCRLADGSLCPVCAPRSVGTRGPSPCPVCAPRSVGARGPSPVGDRAAVDLLLAQLSAVIAVRRHARPEQPGAGAVGAGGAGGRDLRDVRLLVGSGGVLRHADPAAAQAVLAAVLGDHGGGWPLPRAAQAVVDRDYVLAPAGLLAADEPAAALALLQGHLRAW